MTHFLWASLAIPVIIHLVYRRRAKTVPFSTLYFLRQIDQRIQRRHRLKRWLLLLVRLALLATLIAALSRPILRSSVFHDASVPTNAVIVLDNTASMRSVAEGTTSFVRAKKAARTVLDSLKSGGTSRIVLFNPSRPAPGATTDLNGVRNRLSRLQCSYGTGLLSGALLRALNSLNEQKGEQNEIYIITDLQKTSWTKDLAAQTERLKEKFPRTTPYLIPTDKPVSRNLAVNRLDFGRQMHVPGRVARIRCEVENTGRTDLSRPLALHTDGTKQNQTQMRMGGGAKRSHVFEHRIQAKHFLIGRVQLGADDYPPDNARYFALPVSNSVPVLLVRSRPSGPLRKDGTYFIQLALETPPDDPQDSSPLRPHIIPSEELSQQVLTSFPVIVLMDLPEIDRDVARQLRDYVMQGGGLVIFPGDDLDPASYNVALGAPSTSSGASGNRTSLLPGTFGTIQKPPPEQDFFRIHTINSQHPLFHGFIDDFNVKDTRISRILAFNLNDAVRDAASTLVSTDAGPLFVANNIGDGTVFLSTTSCDTRWSNMALRPFFPPFLQRLVYHLGSTRVQPRSTTVDTTYRLDPPRDYESGEIRIYPPRTGEDKSIENKPKPVVLEPTKGDETRPLTFSQTAKPGIYRVEYDATKGLRENFFAVNVPQDESDSMSIAMDTARQHFSDDLVVVQDPEQLGESIARQREGLPLWNYLLLVAIALALFETFIANRWLKQH
jgi:hypothetical protein